MANINLTTIDIIHKPEDFEIEPDDSSTRLPNVRANPSLACDSLNRVKVVDIINSVNNNADRVTIIENNWNDYTNEYDGIKTRLVGNKLYMTSDGTAP